MLQPLVDFFAVSLQGAVQLRITPDGLIILGIAGALIYGLTLFARKLFRR